MGESLFTTLRSEEEEVAPGVHHHMAGNEAVVSTKSAPSAGEDSSESDGETEPAKSFHRRFSTNKNIKSSVCNIILLSSLSSSVFLPFIDSAFMAHFNL